MEIQVTIWLGTPTIVLGTNDKIYNLDTPSRTEEKIFLYHPKLNESSKADDIVLFELKGRVKLSMLQWMMHAFGLKTFFIALALKYSI